jgi:isopenicillin-N epimerase
VAAAGAWAPRATAASADFDPRSWTSVRAQFALAEEEINLATFLLAPHPRPVVEAIERHRRGLDADAKRYLEEHEGVGEQRVRDAAAAYLGASVGELALTGNTTTGLGALYGGLRLRSGQEIVTTAHDFFSTHESLRLRALRTGPRVRRIALYRSARTASVDEIVSTVRRSIRPATRVLAVTWVHSSTGVKLPIAQIAAVVRRANAQRKRADRVLLCVDGVHGFGVEAATPTRLGCDFLVSGCHKWLFGPRGTGVVAGSQRGWEAVLPTIPSFTDSETWQAWASGSEPSGPTTASRFTPGGYKAFEHVWALPQAFAFQKAIGKARVAERTHELASHLKEGLRAMPNVTVHTPLSDKLSAGIVSFDLEGLSPGAVVHHLRERRIIASVAPYAVPHVRLTPSIQNTAAEIETVLQEIRALVS